MFSSLTVTLVISLYMAVLFAIAQLVEKGIESRGTGLKGPWIYALSLAVYHTSWTFYGSVGFAASSGLLFLGVYLGAILGVAFWWLSLRRMVHAKETFRITSIADFISTRYNRSQPIAALVTLMALLGVLPYIALQLKAVVSSFQIITDQSSESMSWGVSGLLITLFMIAFTIMFGLRRLDPTERHQGMITALAVECIVKLVAFIAVGLFVSYSLFDGFDDITARLFAEGHGRVVSFSSTENSGIMWLTLIILSFAAVQNLPRQFHVAVVENANHQHIKTAIWLFPLYMVLINLFVVPIAAAGLLMGLPESSADFYVLLLPQMSGNTGLTMLAFIGGFSAATGMIIITTMTLSTMASNHLILPVMERMPGCSFMKPYLLQIRWLLVALILLGSYGFAIEFSDSYILVAIGLISFVAVLQFTPALFGGIFWSRGNSMGAFAGLLVGFVLWSYTLVIPAFIKNGWLGQTLMDEGLFGLSMLRPEALFGLEGLSSIPHSVFWTLVFNIAFYVLGSLLYSPHKAERTHTTEFICAMNPAPASGRARPTGLDRYIALEDKINEAQTILENYLNHDKAKAAVVQITEDLQVSGKSHIAIIELLEFHRMVEHVLAGSIGSASAHKAMEASIRYNKRESSDLKAIYSHLVAEMNNQPEEDNDLPFEQRSAQNFGLINNLQSKVHKLEQAVQTRDKQIEQMEIKLEARYQEIFRYRLETQKTRQENEALKLQIEKSLNIETE